MKRRLLLLSILFCFAVSNSIAQKKRDLIPDFVVTQYAGSIGYGSMGVGYDLNKRARTSIHYGFVPERVGGKLHIISLKFQLTPVAWRLNENFQIRPIDLGVMSTYHFGDKFHNRWPSRYPDHYYWWTSSLRFHLLTESSITYTLPNPQSFVRSVAGYIEFNTNDLYVVSLAQNYKSINFFDIVKSGVGIRIRF